MGICICDISALELYRSSGRLLPDLLERPRTSKLDNACMPTPLEIADEFGRLGLKESPYHVLVGNMNRHHVTDEVICHVCSQSLHRRSLVRIDSSYLVTGPELTFCNLAARRDIDDAELLQIGHELCGTYVLDKSWDGLTNTDACATTASKIRNVLEASPGMRGIKRARDFSGFLNDGSNSPMETVLAILLTAPPRLGGLGLKGAKMNHRILTADGSKYVDIAFPERKVGLEYKGKKAHAIERTERDDRRQNRIIGSGMTILNVWYEDLASPHLFERLIADFTRTAGIRLRIRHRSFPQKHDLLRAQLMPRVERYGTLASA